MNKKLALLMFSIGIGVASAPAFAFSCVSICHGRYVACLKDANQTAEACFAINDACQQDCEGCAESWHAGC